MAESVTSARNHTVAVTGSRGLVGSAVTARLSERGYTIKQLVRHEPREGNQVYWSPSEGRIDAKSLEGMDAVIHLAGEPIDGRWSRGKKQRIRDSRVKGTQLLSEALAGLEQKPEVLISASAVGIYGDRGDALLEENSTRGEGFLPQVAAEWEQAADLARQAGIRVAHPRFGVILSPNGGALAKMLPAFRMGVAGRLGDGQQWMPWVAIDDVVEVLKLMLERADLSGPVNVVSPEPVTNSEFTRTLAQVLSRPAVLPVPRLALRLAVGELADEGLLVSQRVRPSKLLQHGFHFRFVHLELALRHYLSKTSAAAAA